MNSKNISASRAGFTLIELLISVGIIIIISAITIPNFSNFINSQNLRQAQEGIKSGIRDAQNRALSGVDAGQNVCGSGGTTACTHWGIRFLEASSTFQLGRTSDVSSCTLEVVDVTSEALPGDVLTQPAGGNQSCVFFGFVSGSVTMVNLPNQTMGSFTAPAICINAGGTGVGSWISVNSIGRVRGVQGYSAACP